jgi:hypothetical protein
LATWIGNSYKVRYLEVRLPSGLNFFLAFLVWPLLPTHCRCTGLLFHLITLRHATLGRTSLDERSARCRDFYLTTHIYKRQTSMPPAGFEPAILSKRAAPYLRLRPRGHWDRRLRFRYIYITGDWKWKRIETEVVEEYCWAITQLGGYTALIRFQCIWVWISTVQHCIHVTISILSSDFRTFRLEPDLSECNYYVSRGVYARCTFQYERIL